MPLDTILKTIRHSRQKLSQHEEIAVSAIDAGMLAERTSTGIQPHSTDGAQPQPVMFCKERRSGGMEFGDTYEVDNPAITVVCSEGAGVNGLLAAGESVSHGDLVVSAGDGTVRAAAGDGSEDSAAVGEVDMGEQAVNRPNNADTDVNNTNGSEPVGVPLEVI